MATIEEAAAGLAQALRSGNAQESEAALALYADALGDDEAPAVELSPIKRVLAPEEAASVSEVGGGTEADQEAAAANASDATPATTTIDAGDVKTLDEISQPIVPSELLGGEGGEGGEDAAPEDDAGEDVEA